jgi:hypothetical protein
VGVSSHEGIRESEQLSIDLFMGHHRAKVLQVYLVNDTCPGWDDPEIVEGALSPLEEGVAFLVAFHLLLDVIAVGVGCSVMIHLDRMVDDKVSRNHRVHQRGFASAASHGRPHGGKINDGRYACKVLEDHPSRHKGDGRVVVHVRRPGSKALDVLKRGWQGCRSIAGVSQDVFQEDPDGVGQAVENTKPGLFQGVQPEERIVFVPDSEVVFRIERKCAFITHLTTSW